MGKNQVTVKAKVETRDKLNSLSRELSSLEDNRVPVPEVLKRTFGSEDIVKRLRAGAIERKMRKG